MRGKPCSWYLITKNGVEYVLVVRDNIALWSENENCISDII